MSTKACREALHQLRTHKALNEAAMSLALDVDIREVSVMLAWPLKKGEIVRERRADNLYWYSLGKEVEAPDADIVKVTQSPGLYVVQESVPPAPPPEVAPAAAPHKASRLRRATTEQGEPKPRFACALYSDGRLVMEVNGQAVTLQKDDAQALVRYLRRVDEEVAA